MAHPILTAFGQSVIIGCFKVRPLPSDGPGVLVRCEWPSSPITGQYVDCDVTLTSEYPKELDVLRREFDNLVETLRRAPMRHEFLGAIRCAP